MIAVNRLEKTKHLKFLLSQLWQGNTAIAIEYLKRQVNAKNLDKWHELISYLEKHQLKIINYKRRSRAGKTIGSGRMEKGVDLSVKQRQKNKGMSWSRLGSKALSLLKTAELNAQWQQLWFPALAA
jgi:signal recognition particle GTPase